MDFFIGIIRAHAWLYFFPLRKVTENPTSHSKVTALLRKHGLKGVGNGKIDIFKELTPIRGPMSSAAKGKKVNTKSRQTNTSHCDTKTKEKNSIQNQDKQTPHTVLQKLRKKRSIQNQDKQHLTL